MQYIMGNVNLIFVPKNLYLRQGGQKLNTRLEAPRIMQWNQILKNYANGLLDKQTELFIASELHAKCVHFQKDLNVYSLK